MDLGALFLVISISLGPLSALPTDEVASSSLLFERAIDSTCTGTQPTRLLPSSGLLRSKPQGAAEAFMQISTKFCQPPAITYAEGLNLVNSGQWTSMFASMDTDIGSDLPLWAVQDDFEPGVSTVDSFFGGWTTAFAKQYHLAIGTDLPLCSASVDLDSFTA
ncbi:MAG: hypothetical protein Q9161_007619 [Pseudevernia consocians]